MSILFFIVLGIEVFLSHQSGEESGAESRALAKSLHVPEKWLRTSAHVVLFAALSFFALLAFLTISLWLRIAAVGVWCFADEWSKGWACFLGRHFSWIDVSWNALGWGIGIAVFLCVRSVISS